MKPRTVTYAFAALVVLIALSVWGAKWAARKDERIRAAIEGMTAARVDARAARTVASQALASAAHLDTVANAYKDTSATRLAQANGFKHDADSLKREFEKLAGEAPDTCAPVVASARLAIAKKEQENGALRLSLGAAIHRGDTLEKALLTVTPATAGLIHADAKLDTAATKVANEVRPKFLRRMVNAVADFGRPKIGIGVGGTYDPLDGKVHGGPTLFLGWTF